MERVRLGSTGIEVSKLGFGTGSAHPSGRCAQALMKKEELAALLIYAFERGINFWDTAYQYETYPHIREALKGVRRSDVVIATKLISSGGKDTIRDFDYSLRALGVDYVDVCLLHGIRTQRELKDKLGAFDTLIEFKRQGKVRAVGLSSHGLSALKAASEVPDIEVVWVRINFAGLCMDTCKLGLYDRLASVAWLKKSADAFLPKWIRAYIRPTPESQLVSDNEVREIKDIVKRIHSQSKGIVGMKVLAEGRLRNDVRKAIGYIKSLNFVHSFVVGMVTRDEIDENCRLMES